MKRFIVSVLFATVFSIGLGALVDQAKDHLRPLGKEVSLLRSIADYALARDR